MIVSEKKYSYFQLSKELDLPILIKVCLADFDSNLSILLREMQFHEMTQEAKDSLKILANLGARILKIVPASPLVARKIGMNYSTDQYGCEQLMPKSGHNIYRYKGSAIIVYDVLAREWELGVLSDFATKDNKFAFRVVINRFLSWALLPLGMIGFWGVPVNDAVVVMRQRESGGEAFYYNLKKNCLLTVDGVQGVADRPQIMRLDSTVHSSNKVMTSEELVCFLTFHTSYLEFENMDQIVKQAIYRLAQCSVGVICPKKNFKARSDLSM